MSPAEEMIQFAKAEADRNKVVSGLADIEARSTIFRPRQGKALTADQASSALGSLASEMKRMIEQPIHVPVIESARTLVERHLLRALDAIQLASAVAARDSLSAPEMRFVAADKELLMAAAKEGFIAWDPTI